MSDDLEPLPDAVVSGTRLNKGGRPRKLLLDEATLKKVQGLGRLQCTVRECAAFLGVSPTTFEAFLKRPAARAAFDGGKEIGKMSLRRAQIRAAEKGNPALLIFLGKNLLGQRDQTGVDLTTGERPLTLFELYGKLGTDPQSGPS